jgi:malonyl-CoA O-methyltransferase
MLLGALEGHALWSATYDADPNPLLELERRTVASWLSPLRGKTVVDVGCGTGRWIRYAQQQGAVACGLDLCEPMLRKGTGRYVQADALQLPVRDACADFAVCAFTAGYLESPARLIAELARITRRGGRILVTDVHPSAIASGWRRSFRSGSVTYDIENFAHSVQSLIRAGSRNGLSIMRTAEPSLGEPERHIFRECGRESRFESACAIPAIYALLWKRT